MKYNPIEDVDDNEIVLNKELDEEYDGLSVQSENSYREPTVFKYLKWWEENIDNVDSTWILRIILIHKGWLANKPLDKRRFLSDFLNDVHEQLEHMVNILIVDNHIIQWEWASEFAYIMTMFNYLFTEYYEKLNDD